MDALPADVAFGQLRAAARGVGYPDEGWRFLVDGLLKAATGSGAEFRARTPVTGIGGEPGAWRVRTLSGEEIDAAAVVVATGTPAGTRRLLPAGAGGAGGVVQRDPGWDGLGPEVTAACLDLGVRHARARLAFGLDEPLYLSPHAPGGNLAPAGMGMVHVMRYGATAPAADRSRLEAFAAAAGIAPGDVVTSRFLPNMTVVTALPAVGTGLKGRPPVAVPGVPGLFVAGDWAGPAGWLSDASLASGERAGLLAARAVTSARSRRWPATRLGHAVYGSRPEVVAPGDIQRYADRKRVTAVPQTSDFVLERLREWGVHRVFGYPGDGINGMLGAFGRTGGDPEFIQPRHEEMAAFMACGHAKFTGEAGCCMATSGPGAIHLLNGLYDAKLDHQPVVAIVGQQKRISLGALYQQEVDLGNLFSDVSEFCQVVMHPAQTRHVIDRAFKTALTHRGVCTVIIPEDVQEEEAQPSPPKTHGAVYSSVGWSRPRVLPDEAELARAADILNDGKKVAILAGQGAAKAQAELAEVAELLGAGVAKTLLGREVLPDSLPFVTGPIGLLGSMPSDEMVMNCDTFLMVGTSFPYAEWLPEEGSARAVEIDIDGSMIGMRYPVEANLVGDSKETLKLLIPKLRRKEDRSWREEIEKNVRTWERITADRAAQSFGGVVNPQAVVSELSPKIPDGAILTSDSGSATNWWARHLSIREGMRASLSGTLATMGPGVPYAIAARFAYPGRPVIAFEGDGAFQMNGMNEMITVKRYLDRLSGPAPFIFCVFNNQDLNQVTWEQRAMGGDPKFPGSQDIPDVPYHKYAELLGLRGIFCDDPGGVGAAWDEALASDRPVVCEFKTDPEIPPLPPHIMKEQAKKSAKAELRDPERKGLALHGFRQKMAEFYEKLPGRDK